MKMTKQDAPMISNGGVKPTAYRPRVGDVVTVGQGVRHWRVDTVNRAGYVVATLLDGTELYAPTVTRWAFDRLHPVERPQ